MILLQKTFSAGDQKSSLTIFFVGHGLLDTLDDKRTLPIVPFRKGGL